LKLALHGGLQSAGCHGKIRRIGITEHVRRAAGIDRDGPRNAEIAAGERGGIKRLPGGAQFDNERIRRRVISLKARNIYIAGGIGLHRIDHAVGEIRQGGNRLCGLTDRQDEYKEKKRLHGDSCG
jgi:hypothetical protein